MSLTEALVEVADIELAWMNLTANRGRGLTRLHTRPRVRERVCVTCVYGWERVCGYIYISSRDAVKDDSSFDQRIHSLLGNFFLPFQLISAV